jgi:hypothetical protein
MPKDIGRTRYLNAAPRGLTMRRLAEEDRSEAKAIVDFQNAVAGGMK